LPKVENESSPYILLSKNPNGVYSVGAIPASSPTTKHEAPPTVSFEADEPPYIGIFGMFGRLTVTLSKKPVRAYIQSLIRGEAQVLPIDGNEITVSADLLTTLHPSKDGSQSAVIIKLEY
jgi:hypothetical protein